MEQDALGCGGAESYEVEWIIDGVQGGVFTQLPANAVVRVTWSCEHLSKLNAAQSTLSTGALCN